MIVPDHGFDAPWEARAFAMAVALVERLGVPWDDFRSFLMGAVADDPDRPYWESWTVALERFAASVGLPVPA